LVFYAVELTYACFYSVFESALRFPQGAPSSLANLTLQRSLTDANASSRDGSCAAARRWDTGVTGGAIAA